MQKVTLWDKLRYRFDNTLARGTGALIGWLFLASALMITAVAALVVASGIAPDAEGGERPGFGSMVWFTLMRALDAGTVGGDAGSIPFLAAMFGVTIGGIFLVSTLIGILTSGLENRLSDLRKGRSLVCEKDHTVILGWSPQIFSVVSELLLANESRRDAAIVILAERDKVEMEDALREKVRAPRGIRVVCRTGSPIDPGDLAIVNPNEARAIMVLGPEEGDADAHVIKTILALVNGPERRADRYHIVAEIRDPKNLEAAQLVAKDEAKILPVSELIASITVQTCRQSGLSAVYTELLDFGGDEIYMAELPALAGKTFGEALFAFDTCTLIGLRRKDGRVQLNPPMDGAIEKGDAVVVIAEDDTAVRLGAGKTRIDDEAIRSPWDRTAAPEQVLILGWNRRGPAILAQLDRYVAAGSAVTVVAEGDAAGRDVEESRPSLANLKVHVEAGDTNSRRTLDRVTARPYDHVITLSYSDELGTQEADAKTLVTLLHLRDIAAKTGKPFSIVSEMLDVRNQKLAEVTRADDFIVSDKLVSLMMTQIAENADLAAVFADLFDPEGSELYLKPAGEYVEAGRATPFATVAEAARRRGEVAIGYRIAREAGDATKAYGVKVNPAKGEKVRFAQGDKVIVLAEG
ncbi:CASTOR/POLLUX-related putative ion channel [Polyangium aurulentum]|uniref:CASTOR/POLLUX-related putative ion channel n=1 Tax=Polyangium aurulentum TaxID=2567896 RepID=UPI0010AEA084|nr:potassium transporter TrkA [Polyangium aurulentum]UQA60089.1 potassium transporter TrkA [Polyangium aurulentum]